MSEFDQGVAWGLLMGVVVSAVVVLFCACVLSKLL